jgi:hypothetical protein
VRLHGCCVFLAVVGAAAVWLPLAAQEGDEAAPRFSAAELLPAAILQGPHHRVNDEVRTDGYFHAFTVSSTYGTFDATGRSQLAVRIREVAALTALDEVSKTEVFLSAAGQSVVKIGQGAASVVTDPVGTAKGMAGGVKRMGVNLGRRTQRAVSSADDTADAGAESSAAASAASSVLGVSGAMRRWAQKVGVDPYTTNQVLRQALADVAKVDAAGAIATRVAVPVPAPVGTLASVGDIVWARDPEEVRKINERGLRTLGVPDEVAGALFRSRWFTLTYQTRLVAALLAAPVPGVSDYVRTATSAGSEREALFFVESAELLQARPASERGTVVLPDSRALVTATASGHVRALLPLDWVGWTADTRVAMEELTRRARDELRGTRLEAVVTGAVSERARRELMAMGWVVVPAGTVR